MEIARIVQSAGGKVIALPEGFDIAETEMEVQRDGRNIVLKPVTAKKPGEDEWAWLDRINAPMDADFSAALEESEGDFERPDPLA